MAVSLETASVENVATHFHILKALRENLAEDIFRGFDHFLEVVFKGEREFHICSSVRTLFFKCPFPLKRN